jgi:hypothetical protein
MLLEACFARLFCVLQLLPLVVCIIVSAVLHELMHAQPTCFTTYALAMRGVVHI